MLFPDPLAISEPGVDAVAMSGGRVRREIPETRSRISSLTVLAMLRADADWVDEAANPEQKAKLKGVDPRHHPDAGCSQIPSTWRASGRRAKRLSRRSATPKHGGATDEDVR
jgi:hypothetical protein